MTFSCLSLSILSRFLLSIAVERFLFQTHLSASARAIFFLLKHTACLLYNPNREEKFSVAGLQSPHPSHCKYTFFVAELEMAQLRRLSIGSFLFLSLILSACSVLDPVLASGPLRSLPVTPFDEGYTHLFGDENLVVHRDGKSVLLCLDERTGLH